jgi:hypothetical protein
MKKISEYGGKEMYKSKAQMMKHEKAETPKMEKKEKKMYNKGGMANCGASMKPTQKAK